MDGVSGLLAVRTNETGLLTLVREQFGYKPNDVILKCSGRSFIIEELESEIRSIII